MKIIKNDVAHKSKIVAINEFPEDTGNLKYNATDMKYYGQNKGFQIKVEEAEADYVRDVFEYYLYKRGENFMYDAALAVYLFLNSALTYGNPELNEEYLRARRQYKQGYEDTYERSMRNIEHGTGLKADPTLRKHLLGDMVEKL